MTINIAPAASGTNTLPLSAATPTAKVRKNAPIASTAYFRVATPHWGAGNATDSCSLVMTSAICFSSLSFQWLTQRSRACGFAVIVASGHLSPRPTELTEFLLAATVLVNLPSVQAETASRQALAKRREW